MDKETARIFARCESLDETPAPFRGVRADAGQLQPPVEPKRRSEQDLLAERRANVLELARETDPTARALLQFHIDTIDRELHARFHSFAGSVVESVFVKTREATTRTEPMLATAFDWSPAQHVRAA